MRIIKAFTVLLFCFSLNALYAQIYNPVKWETSVKALSGTEAELIITAKIEKGWHLYSQYLPSDQGPVATTFTFEPGPYKLAGKVAEGKPIKEHDPNFDMEVNYFKDKAVFRQKINIKSNKDFTLKGTVYFMVCDDSKCLPPEEVSLEFKVKAPAKPVMPDTAAQAVLDSVITAHAESLITVAKDTGQFITDVPIAGENTETLTSKECNFLAIFIAGFLGGLLALITPCVFPMIPLTVSFFTKQSKTRSKGIINALVYSVNIILIYVGLGFIITKLLGPDALNAFASNVWMNLIFFVVFVIFAISFLGAFEITLPSSWINKADAASDKGGLIGIFFMAFTLSLVSFSCTGPIIGTLLVEAAVNGGYLCPLMGMLGFSVALALPFGLFAAFPGWLNSLPKSGGWLNSVKVVLGLLELALALKFLSNVDLAYHWGILTREVFIALWIIIFTITGFYLMGKIKFSHDTDTPYVSIPRLFLAIITFSFVVYLIPGMWGAPLKLISGFPPPAFYTEGWKLGGGESSISENKEIIKGVDRSHCPHNLSCFHDYDLALAHAKKTGKPLMIDFTGWSCVNCRKMEDKVWIDPRVLERLENDYVLVSLYVDDKEILPESEQYVSPVTGKKIKTIGNKWSDFQTSRFNTNSQPWYVLLDHSEKELNQPVGYDPDIEKYIRFLDEGKREFEKRNSIQ